MGTWKFVTALSLFWWLDQPILWKNEWVSVLLWVLGAAKTTLCAKTVIHPHIPESHRVSHMDWKLFAFVVSFSHQRTRQIYHHLVSLRTELVLEAFLLGTSQNLHLLIEFDHFWEAEWYLYSVIIGKPNYICIRIRIRSFLGSRKIFVFVLSRFWETE